MDKNITAVMTQNVLTTLLCVNYRGRSQHCKMASEKKFVSNFTVKVGLVLFAGCILVPISLVTMFIHYAVPLQTCKLLHYIQRCMLVSFPYLSFVFAVSVLFSVDSASHNSGNIQREHAEKANVVFLLAYYGSSFVDEALAHS